MINTKQIRPQSPQAARPGWFLEPTIDMGVVGVFVMAKRVEYDYMEKVGACYFLEDAGSNGNKKRIALFKCGRCGSEFTAVISSLISGNTTSCGCYGDFVRDKTRTRHGLSNHPLHRKWISIKQRCYNKNNRAYKYYGARGIRMWSEWVDDFEMFYKYVQKLPEFGKNGYSLDRIDNDGNYEPGNLRWATWHVQGTNQRRRPMSNTGYIGVSYHNCTGKYASYISINGRLIRFGEFDNPEHALNVRNKYIIDNDLHEYDVQKWEGINDTI